MKLIYKYGLYDYPNDGTTFMIPMPEGADVLSLQLQQDRPVLWALVPDRDEDDEPEPIVRRLILIMTGEAFNFDAPFTHLATVQKANGLVGHIFIDEFVQ